MSKRHFSGERAEDDKGFVNSMGAGRIPHASVMGTIPTGTTSAAPLDMEAQRQLVLASDKKYKVNILTLTW
jgi:hypothetical protein